MNEPQPREGPVRIHPLTALSAFRQVAVDMLGGGGGDLSWRQTAVLLTIYLTPGPHSVGGLARARGLPKPAVTRALDALVRAGLARRQRPEGDRRQVIVHRTVAGSTRLRELGDRFASSLEGASPFDALRVRSEPRMPSKQEPRHV